MLTMLFLKDSKMFIQSFLGYIYYYLYCLAKKLHGKDPNDSAELYMSSIILLLSFPLMAWGLITFLGKGHNAIYLITGLFHAVFVHYLNFEFIQKKINKDEVIKTYNNNSQIESIIGHIVVILLLAGSPILGIYILSFL